YFHQHTNNEDRGRKQEVIWNTIGRGIQNNSIPVMCFGIWALSKTGWNILKDAELKYGIFTEKHFITKGKSWSAEGHLSLVAQILGMRTVRWASQGYRYFEYNFYAGRALEPICCSFHMNKLAETRNPREFIEKFSVFHKLDGWCGLSKLDAGKDLS